MISYRNISRYSILMIALLITFAFTADNQRQKEKLLMQSIMKNLSGLHYKPVAIDDSLSSKAFDLYIQRLDYNKRFLLQSDYEELSSYRYSLDDQLKAGNTEFFDLTNDLIEMRLKEGESYYKSGLEHAFDFTDDETIELDKDKLVYCESVEDLQDRWRKSIKYDVLTRIVTKLETQEKAVEKNDTTIKIKTFEELESDMREKVGKRNKDWFDRMYQTERKDRFTAYINSFVNIFDPHSGYYPPKVKEDFDIKFSGKLEGIGATLQQKDGYVKVVRIIPGSASWRQGELKEGDLIMKVAQGDEEPVDLMDMRLDDAVRLIRGPKGTEVRLTVKKIDESIAVIPIIRDIVLIEETFAKSVILKDSLENFRAGYIKLPSFYMDFNDSKGRSSYVDVKSEIERLEAEGIDGLIFDLRGNGGGSLIDAVKIAGLFIEKGPVVQVKSRSGAPYIFEDKDPEVQYDGPLIILVNSFSASASEILAAAMQDYDRAIIMGSETTFGKGTVQRFYDLDRTVPPSMGELKPLGSLKVTTQKFYRVNGGATQLKGVTPDIILPDRYKYIDVGEKERDYAMDWSIIESIDYSAWSGYKTNLNDLKTLMDSKLATDSTFLLVDENAMRLKNQREYTNYSLNLTAYRDFKNNRKEASKKYKKIGKEQFKLEITPLQAELEAMKTDSIKMAGAEKWHKELRKDIYINEALNVMGKSGIVYQD